MEERGLEGSREGQQVSPAVPAVTPMIDSESTRRYPRRQAKRQAPSPGKPHSYIFLTLVLVFELEERGFPRTTKNEAFLGLFLFPC